MSARSFSQSDLPTRLALGEQEGVGHAAADDQEVDLVDEVAEELELGRDFGAADDRRDAAAPDRRARATAPRAPSASRVRHRPAACAQAFGRGMGAVGGGEGVVDIDVAELGELGDKSRVVLLLALVEAGVFEQQDVAVLHCRRSRPRPSRRCSRRRSSTGRPRTSATAAATGRSELASSGPALGPAEMREQDDLAALVRDLLDRRRDALDPRRVGDVAVLHRHVEIDAQAARACRRRRRHRGCGRLGHVMLPAKVKRLDWLPAAAEPEGRRRAKTRSDQLAHRDRRVGHAVGEAPFVVVPGQHAHERAVDHLGLVEMEDRRAVVVVEVGRDIRLVGIAEDALERAVAVGGGLDRLVDLFLARRRAWRRT